MFDDAEEKAAHSRRGGAGPDVNDAMMP